MARRAALRRNPLTLLTRVNGDERAAVLAAAEMQGESITDFLRPVVLSAAAQRLRQAADRADGANQTEMAGIGSE